MDGLITPSNIMDLIFNHTQKRKTDKGKCNELYELNIFHNNDLLLIEIDYLYTFNRPKDNNDQEEYTLSREVKNEYTVTIDLSNSNVWTYSHITTKGFFGERHGGRSHKKRNDFKTLSEITTDALFNGCKKSNEWGKRFGTKINEAFYIVKNILQPHINNEYLKSKEYYKVEVDPLFDLIVDYHLDKKRIKGHNLVYIDIQQDYPKEKFLKLNDRKFVPAILDGYGIKTKQYVSLLNNNEEGLPIIIKTLNYFCKLFGDNYIDFMNKINWELHAYTTPPTSKTHTLKNETEKRNMVKLISNWESHSLRGTNISNDGSLVKCIHNTLELRDKIEKKGIELKFTAKSDDELDTLYEEWMGLKKYITRGYRLRYAFPKEFVNTIEREIRIGDVIYQPILLKREEDFKIEGHIMKNCMGNQFSHGAISIYISLRKGKRWVDVQYRNGEKHMCYGKANSPIPKDFVQAVEVLNKRFKKFKTIEWNKEKYDLI